MPYRLSTPASRVAPQLSEDGQALSIDELLAAIGSPIESGMPGMTLPKSSGILVGQGEGDRGGWDDLAIGNKVNAERSVEGGSTPVHAPEPRYAYYRRCQQFRRNGEQCKAPAMKGEAICYRHAEQTDMERRRQQQRREILSRPGAGLGSFREAQRTLSELIRAILAGRIDGKVAGRLLIEIQNAMYGDPPGR